MAKKKNAEAVHDDLDGTVEGLARDHFEQEKAEYEARTGEKVWFEPATPLTRTPITAVEPADQAIAANPEPADLNAEGEGDA